MEKDPELKDWADREGATDGAKRYGYEHPEGYSESDPAILLSVTTFAGSSTNGRGPRVIMTLAPGHPEGYPEAFRSAREHLDMASRT